MCWSMHLSLRWVSSMVEGDLALGLALVLEPDRNRLHFHACSLRDGFAFLATRMGGAMV